MTEKGLQSGRDGLKKKKKLDNLLQVPGNNKQVFQSDTLHTNAVLQKMLPWI